MKLEPLKKAKLPKYAAVFAALAVSAAMLTGCHDPGPDLAGEAQPYIELETSVQTELTETPAETAGEEAPQ